MRLVPVLAVVPAAMIAAGGLGGCRSPSGVRPAPAPVPPGAVAPAQGAAPATGLCAAPPAAAGAVTLADSTRYPRPELGTLYRYRDSTGQRFDAFIYPVTGWSDPETQARETLQALELEQQRGRMSDVQVVLRGTHALSLSSSGPEPQSVGYRMLLLVKLRDGGHESYYAVYPVGERYVKFRVTYPTASSARERVEAFTRDVIASMGSSGMSCDVD